MASELKTKKIYIFIAMVTLLISFSACGRKNAAPTEPVTDSKEEVIDVENLKSANAKESAERIAANGERLMVPTGFMYADKVFEKALAVDPQNKKAKFYRTVLKPFLLFRGIWKRIEPLEKKGSGRLQADYRDFIADLAPGGLREFLFDGKPDLNSEADLQTLLKQVSASLEESRVAFKGMKDDILELNLTWIHHGRDYFRQCSVVEVSPAVFKISRCPYTYQIQRTADRADFEILQQVYAGIEVFLVLVTAYDLQDLISIEKFAREPEPRPLPELIFDEIMKLEKFGKLKPDHFLKIIPNLGSEMLTAAKWAYRLSSILCSTGVSSNDFNRPNYLFSRGICFDRANARGKPIEETFDLVDQLLQGKPQTIDVSKGLSDKEEITLRTPVNPIVLATHPIADLKSIIPTGYNCNNHANQFADQSWGGVLPNKNATEFMDAFNPECRLEEPLQWQ